MATLKFHFDNDDCQKVKEVVKQNKLHEFYKKRVALNIERSGLDLSQKKIWREIMGCLLTTQQRSGRNSVVDNFFDEKNKTITLDIDQVKIQADDKKIREELSKFWRNEIITNQIFKNCEWLEKKGGWTRLESILEPLKNPPSDKNKRKELERKCANSIDDEKNLKGLGPKQSRNLLQALGLTHYEIPIDSRIAKWIKNKLGKEDGLPLLSVSALSDQKYYCAMLDAIQELCDHADELPCIFDAAVFASFEKQP